MNCSLRIALSLTSLLLLAAPALDAQTPEFSVDVVGSSGQPNAMNVHGQIVGWRSEIGIVRGYVATGGQSALLPLPAGMNSAKANDINDAGVIVGITSSSSLAETGFAVRWDPTPSGYVATLLDPLPGLINSNALAINNLGDIVGYTNIGGFGGGPATLFVDSTNPTAPPADLTFLGLGGTPTAINDARQIVGGRKRADLDTGVTEDLGVPTGGSTAYTSALAQDINEAGQVASTLTIATGSSNVYAVGRYTDGAGWTVLSGGGAVNAALSVDAQGRVLFQMGVGAGNRIALYTEGVGVRFVDDLLPAGFDTFGTWAGALNDVGQMAVPSSQGLLRATPSFGAIATSGCGQNPAGSLTWTGGTAQPGATLELSVHNPLGTQSLGSATFLAYTATPGAGFPCGAALPGFGLDGGDGALVVDAASPAFASVAGAPWNGSPVAFPLPLPAVASLSGLQVFAQGLVVDPAPGANVLFGLTEGLTISLGL